MMRICALALDTHWRWYPVLFCICQSLSWRDMINIWFRLISSINHVSNYHIDWLSLSWQQQLRVWFSQWLGHVCCSTEETEMLLRIFGSISHVTCESALCSPLLIYPWSPALSSLLYIWCVKCNWTIKQGEHCTLEWQHIALLEHCWMTIVTYNEQCNRDH